MATEEVLGGADSTLVPAVAVEPTGEEEEGVAEPYRPDQVSTFSLPFSTFFLTLNPDPHFSIETVPRKYCGSQFIKQRGQKNIICYYILITLSIYF